MLSSIEKATGSVDKSMVSLLDAAENLKLSFETIEERVYGLASSKRSILFTCLMGFLMLIIILGRRSVSWGMGLFSGLGGGFFFLLMWFELP